MHWSVVHLIKKTYTDSRQLLLPWVPGVFSSRLAGCFGIACGPTEATSGEPASSLRKRPIIRDSTTGFPAKWYFRNECRNSLLMKRHYPDLGSASDWSCRVGNLLQPKVLPKSGWWHVISMARTNFDIFNNYSSSPNGLRVNSPWGRRPASWSKISRIKNLS